MRPVFILLPALLLTACSKADNEPGPGGVTVGEARALDEAAQMIEDQRLAPAATPSIPPPPDQAKAKPPG